MKKRVKAKGPKGSSKQSAEAAPELPSLVTAMMKLVERLEGLERKMDLVLGRLSNLPSEIRNAVQPLQRLNAPQHAQPAHPAQVPQRPDHGSADGHGHDGRRERMMYKAVCADCKKNCEVPFKPTEERPVYCKECFAIRKSGHAPQDPDSRSIGPQPQSRAHFIPSPMDYNPQGIGKQKSARNAGVKSKKKSKR